MPEGENKLSPEEMAQAQEERTKSDARFLQGGGHFVSSESRPRLNLTEKQMEEMGKENETEERKKRIGTLLEQYNNLTLEKDEVWHKKSRDQMRRAEDAVILSRMINAAHDYPNTEGVKFEDLDPEKRAQVLSFELQGSFHLDDKDLAPLIEDIARYTKTDLKS